MAFVQLKRGSDWGVNYLAVEPLNEHGFSDYKRAMPFKEGQAVTYRFPDGTVHTGEVVFKTFFSTAYDHGNKYDTQYQLPGIVLDVHGVKSWTCLDRVEVELPEED